MIPVPYSVTFYKYIFTISSIIIVLSCFHSLIFLIFPVVKMTFFKKKDYVSEIDNDIMQDSYFNRSSNLINRTSSSLA